MGSENIDMEIEVRMSTKEDQMNAQRCTENLMHDIIYKEGAQWVTSGHLTNVFMLRSWAELVLC